MFAGESRRGQSVLWALAKTCPLRHGDNWQDARRARSDVADAKSYLRFNHSIAEGVGVCGDVLFTAASKARDNANHASLGLFHPIAGFPIKDRFKKIGDLEAIKGICGTCPANSVPGAVADCSGSLFVFPHLKTLEDRIQDATVRLGLRDTVEALFPPSKVTWLRFWMRSPLSQTSMIVLRKILGAIEGDEMFVVNENFRGGEIEVDRHRDQYRGFLMALDRGIANGLEMHVHLQEPGYMSIGFGAVAHCPKCKAEILPFVSETTIRKLPRKPFPCWSCGEVYSVAGLQSYNVSHLPPYAEFDWERDDLRKQLRDEDYRRLLMQYYQEQNATEWNAKTAIEAELEVARENEHWQEFDARRRLFYEEYLFKGLTNLTPYAKSKSRCQWEWHLELSADDFAELLRRSEEYGVDVRYLRHESDISNDLDRDGIGLPEARMRPVDVFERWRSEGCCEFFSAVVNASEQVVDSWWNTRKVD